jgi:hypothetical protein
MSYHNLTNEEIIFLYNVSSSVVEQYEETFDGKTITQTLPTEMGSVEVTIGLPADFLEEIKESKHYTVMKQVYIKLKPLYELIKEAEPDLVQEIDNLFTKNSK